MSIIAVAAAVVERMQGGGHHVHQGIVSTVVGIVPAGLVQRARVHVVQVLAWCTKREKRQ